MPRLSMPTRICLQLLLCLGHYATHSLDQRRIAIDAPRFQEMANFQHQPVNLRISTGQSTEPEAEPKRAFYVDRSLATGHWINKSATAAVAHGVSIVPWIAEKYVRASPSSGSPTPACAARMLRRTQASCAATLMP